MRRESGAHGVSSRPPDFSACEISILSCAACSRDSPCQQAEEIKSLEEEVSKAEGDIDFLLTVDWPAGVEALCPPGSVPENISKPGSDSSALLHPDCYPIDDGTCFFILPYYYICPESSPLSHSSCCCLLSPKINVHIDGRRIVLQTRNK